MAIQSPVGNGSTLSQRGLAARFECSTSTIRRHTKLYKHASGYVRGKAAVWRERWEPVHYADGQLHGYRFVRREGDIERNTIVVVSNRDEHYLKSILGNLREIKAQVDGPSLGGEVLADNVDWLDCFVDRVTRALA